MLLSHGHRQRQDKTTEIARISTQVGLKGNRKKRRTSRKQGPASNNWRGLHRTGYVGDKLWIVYGLGDKGLKWFISPTSCFLLQLSHVIHVHLSFAFLPHFLYDAIQKLVWRKNPQNSRAQWPEKTKTFDKFVWNSKFSKGGWRRVALFKTYDLRWRRTVTTVRTHWRSLPFLEFIRPVILFSDWLFQPSTSHSKPSIVAHVGLLQSCMMSLSCV